MNLQHILIVGAGGFIGAILRYLSNLAMSGLYKSTGWPISTLVINVVGSLLIGVLSKYMEKHEAFPEEIRLALMVGVLGAFTTYSTFSNETVSLFLNGRAMAASANMFLHLSLGLAAVMFGRYLAGS